MPPLTLGYKASAEQFPPQRLLDLAVAAEGAGFDSVWTSDHFQPWRHTDGVHRHERGTVDVAALEERQHLLLVELLAQWAARRRPRPVRASSRCTGLRRASPG